MIQKLVHTILNRPYFIFSSLALFIFLGIYGYFNMDQKLFPNSNRPEIAVVIVQPGASAKDIASNVAIRVEKELYSIDYIRRVYSTTIDEVSVIKAEFEYEKNLNDAAIDVSNTIDKIRSQLPSDIKEPQIHKISAATAPIITLGISSNELPLFQVREIINDQIKQEFQTLQGVANVDLFGGYEKELQIKVDKNKLNSFGLDFQTIINTLSSQAQDFSMGTLHNHNYNIVLKSTNKRDSIKELENLELASNIRLQDIATIEYTYKTLTALYRGNNKDAIALAIQRNLSSDVVKTINKVEQKLSSIKLQYPQLKFEITDTQKTTIVQSNDNMLESLRDAIIMSIIVVFIFLASLRQILVVLLTIPIVYLSTIALMWLFGMEFNIITLTGVILALGLLLDDTVVVVENIQRHYETLHEDMKKAVEDGTSEIMFADFSGTLTTMIAISPILFVGDYPGTIFEPLITTLLLALGASYFISITFVPLISTKILKLSHPIILGIEKRFEMISDGINSFFTGFFIGAVQLAVKSKIALGSYIIALFVLFFISVKIIMPLVGQELMPAMDTGGVKIKITTQENLSIEQSKNIVAQVESILYKQSDIETISSSIGSEAGVLSIGSGGGINDIIIIANYINRFQREISIWDIEANLRKKIGEIKGIKSLEISDSGATAMASIKANLDVTLYGDDLNELYNKAKEYEKAMQNTQGIVNTSLSWHLDNNTYELVIDEQKALRYGLSNKTITSILQTYLKGVNVSFIDKQNQLSTPIKIMIDMEQIDAKEKLNTIMIPTKKGKIPLSSVASIQNKTQSNIITREGLYYTIDILGFREDASISKLMENFENASKDIVLPANIKMKQNGDIAQFNDSAKRIINSVIIGIVLIILIMIPMFESIKIPLIIIASVPLTVAGASWILLLFDYHSSMSAMVGFILLAGVIVNNAILLIHFAKEQQNKANSALESVIEAIRVRTRPVLMTAISVSVGMIPVAFGWAIGIERLAPLGAVVIGGLIVGTFLTLLFIPLLFVWSFREA